MGQIRKELETAADRAVFQTEQPDKIKRAFTASFEAWAQETNTLGGYLRDIRRLRGLSAPECALKTSVSRAQWQAWEGNASIPNQDELEKIIKGMAFGERKRRELYRLQAEAPGFFLRSLAEFEYESLAARGALKVDAELEWQALPPEVQKPVKHWCETRGVKTEEELFRHLGELKSQEQRDEWVREVLKVGEETD